MSASNHFSEVAGIIGGVGPEATTYFMSLLIKHRQKYVSKDQDHIPFLVFNNPQIPDRTEYLVNNKENPLPELLHTAKLLKSAGATFLTIPCNTAHAFIDQIESELGIPVLNMVELTAQHIIRHYGKNIPIGLLATDGTLQSGIYQSEFQKVSSRIQIFTPDQKNQDKVMEAIYGTNGIKASSVNSYNVGLLYDASEELLFRGALAIIAGCTEIPLAFNQKKKLFDIIDPMEILAQKVIQITLASKLRVAERNIDLKNYSETMKFKKY